LPPVTRTLPLGSRVAVCQDRAVRMDPALLQALAAGSNSSALAVIENAALLPPATNTLPSASSVAEWVLRPTDGLPADRQVPDTGSKSSALRAAGLV